MCVITNVFITLSQGILHQWILSLLLSPSTYLTQLEILYNKETCHLQLKKCRFIRLSSKFYNKLGQ